MTTETVSLLVAGGSILSALAAVSINGYVAFRTKEIDAQQKKDDHNRALRAIYVARKVETAEAAIAKWTVSLNRWQLLKNGWEDLLTSDTYTVVDSEKQNARYELAEAKADEFNFALKNSFYLYFDYDIEKLNLNTKEDYAQAVITNREIDVLRGEEQRLRKAEEERVKELIVYEDPDEGGDLEEYKYTCRRIEEKIGEMISYIDRERKTLLNACEWLRNEMSVYDLR